ncbi:MAG: nucleoside 2-deoxyribosyltransferase [Phenylobacterium sp.]|uniref:nucleoside 2-deoxyribosyltransferase n=1 Tax=Phenylobacterium sp. TaxID=1871053 RepID=UPI002718FA57|nr:nucleoside 2-deoxyribosyltransferase [Phenylobacterium sp.]MDO8410399.1 nucleoside 2-deoxyribosyltransferase [Phenylobacterium sp.]
MLFAFVLMPFDQEFDDVYRLGIKEVATSLGVVAERVDEQSFSETILERIYRQIETADFIIADMTGRNPNVFYEVGYAHAKKKPVILITKDANDIPFDLKHHRHLIYGDKITGLREKLSAEIAWIKDEINRARTIPISISSRPLWGVLEMTPYRHSAEVYFQFDLHNKTDIRSPDLEAFYLHTGPGWAFKQGAVECPNTKSDLKNYSIRHFIQPSVPRLSPGAWSQVKLIGTKQVWNKYRGGEPLESYKLTGVALIDIATSEGNYTEELLLDVTVDESPF